MHYPLLYLEVIIEGSQELVRFPLNFHWSASIPKRGEGPELNYLHRENNVAKLITNLQAEVLYIMRATSIGTGNNQYVRVITESINE